MNMFERVSSADIGRRLPSPPKLQLFDNRPDELDALRLVMAALKTARSARVLREIIKRL